MSSIPISRRVALLIDAENVQLTYLPHILNFSHRYGNLKICRAYGDWKKPPLSTHLNRARSLNIEIIQVDRVAKDTADKQLMIEAGEILGHNNAEIFIIATGDGDFKLLCERIKRKGKTVIGIGNKGQTSTSLRKSCNEFHNFERLERFLALS